MNLEQDCIISRCIMDNLLDFEPVYERICKISVKGYSLTQVSTRATTEEKDEIAKGEFYSSLEKVCDTVPSCDMKTVLGDINTKV